MKRERKCLAIGSSTTGNSGSCDIPLNLFPVSFVDRAVLAAYDPGLAEIGVPPSSRILRFRDVRSRLLVVPARTCPRVVTKRSQESNAVRTPPGRAPRAQWLCQQSLPSRLPCRERFR